MKLLDTIKAEFEHFKDFHKKYITYFSTVYYTLTVTVCVLLLFIYASEVYLLDTSTNNNSASVKYKEICEIRLADGSIIKNINGDKASVREYDFKNELTGGGIMYIKNSVVAICRNETINELAAEEFIWKIK